MWHNPHYNPIPRYASRGVRYTSADAASQPIGQADLSADTAQPTLSITKDIMHKIFDPITLVTRCVPAANNWCLDYGAEDIPEGGEDGCCGAITEGKWRPAQEVRWLCVVTTVVLYIFVLIWITSIYQGVEVWQMEHPLSDVCTMNTTIGTVSLPTYIQARLAGSVMSTAPFLYLICVTIYHLVQVANYPSKTRSFERWLFIMVVVEFVLSLAMIVLDGSVSSYLNANWSPGAACYEAEKAMLHYSSVVRLPLNTLPVALIILSVPAMAWSLLYIIHALIETRQ